MKQAELMKHTEMLFLLTFQKPLHQGHSHTRAMLAEKGQVQLKATTSMKHFLIFLLILNFFLCYNSACTLFIFTFVFYSIVIGLS